MSPDTCEAYDALLAAHADGELDTAGGNLLARHLAGCASCRAVADTLSPRGDEAADDDALPSIDPGAYALGVEVARGGMGRIIAARDLRVGRPVAVKELLGRSPQLAARFEREARVTARLQHPGIVPIYEIGKWPDGTPFYSMRMVDGRTLREAITAAPTLADRLALLPAVIAAAEAVAFAHGQRVIHRDLTPSNVLVGAYGETVVIDWGLAKDLSLGVTPEDALDGGPYREDASSSLTGVGAVIGTVSYMPPEQARAQPVDERADVYALGAILYHVLAGVPPYEGRSSSELLRQVKAGPPRPVDERVPAAPRDLVSIVEKAMAREPDARYPTARELTEELKRFQTGRMVEAHAYSTAERMLRFVRRYRAAVTVTALATLVLAAFAVVAVSRILRTSADARATASELLLEKGRIELLAGNNLEALAYLQAASAGRPTTPALGFLIGAAVRGVQASTMLDCGGGYVFFVTVSPDGEHLLGACADHARVWRLRDRSPVMTLGPFKDGFYLAAYDATGSTIATWGRDGIARLWDAKTGALRGSYTHGAEISLTTFSPDGARIVTAGFDGYARVWDVATRTQLRAIDGGTLLLRHVYGMLSPDGDDVLTINIEGTGKGWNAVTGELRGGFEHGSFILGGGLSTDGRHAITCGMNRLAKVWNAKTGALVFTLAGHTDVVWKCIFDDAGKRALTTGHDGRANVWDLATGGLLASVEHGDMVWSGTFSPDGRRFATVGLDGRVKVWDAWSGALLASHDSRRGKDARFTPDGRGLIVPRGDGRIEIWDDAVSQAAAFTPPGGTMIVAVSPDGARVVTEAADGWLTIWDATLARALPDARIHAPLATSARADLLAASTPDGIALVELRTGAVHTRVPITGAASLQLSADGTRLVAITAAGAEVWDVPAQRQVTTLVGVRDVVLAPDGRRAVANMTVRDLEGNAAPLVLPLPAGARVLGMTADGTRVVALEAPGSGEQHVSLWDAGTGARLLHEPVASATLDPSGHFLTTIGADRRVTVRRADDGAEQTEFEAEQLVQAQVDARGALVLAVGDLGRAALVLNATDGRVLARWPIEHASPAVRQAGFRPPASRAWWSPDGTRAVTQGKGIAAWHTPIEDAAALRLVMDQVPWRVKNGRLVLIRNRTFRARIVDGEDEVEGARVTVEIRIAPDLPAGEMNWDVIRTQYVTRTVTSAHDGSIALPGLVPGAYTVTVTTDNTTRGFDVVVRADPDDDSVDTLDLASPP